MKKLLGFLKDENGQGMVEYGLIIGFVAVVVVGVIVLFGPQIKTMFDSVGTKIADADSLFAAP